MASHDYNVDPVKQTGDPRSQQCDCGTCVVLPKHPIVHCPKCHATYRARSLQRPRTAPTATTTCACGVSATRSPTSTRRTSNPPFHAEQTRTHERLQTMATIQTDAKIAAFLDLIAWSEGTSISPVSKNDGYDVIVSGVDGKHTFNDYGFHPFAHGRADIVEGIHAAPSLHSVRPLPDHSADLAPLLKAAHDSVVLADEPRLRSHRAALPT